MKLCLKWLLRVFVILIHKFQHGGFVKFCTGTIITCRILTFFMVINPETRMCSLTIRWQADLDTTSIQQP
jgi:hypothetical protein